MPLPDFRWVIRLRDGETLLAEQRDVKRTMDKRTPYGIPEVVFEVRTHSGLIRRLWPEDIVRAEQEAA